MALMNFVNKVDPDEAPQNARPRLSSKLFDTQGFFLDMLAKFWMETILAFNLRIKQRSNLLSLLLDFIKVFILRSEQQLLKIFIFADPGVLL